MKWGGTSHVVLIVAFGTLLTLACDRVRSSSGPDASAERRGPSSPGGRAGATIEQSGSGGRAGAEPADACACADAGKNKARFPLDCFCGRAENAAFCPATLADFDVQSICSEGGSVAHAVGCGKIEIIQSGRYAGTSPIFDASTHALVGVYDFSDIAFGACKANAYVYGQGLFPPGASVAAEQDRCAEIAYCRVCGPFYAEYPLCRKDSPTPSARRTPKR